MFFVHHVCHHLKYLLFVVCLLLDTLLKLAEYGDEDDDAYASEETPTSSVESPKSHATRTPKPFWAV